MTTPPAWLRVSNRIIGVVVARLRRKRTGQAQLDVTAGATRVTLPDGATGWWCEQPSAPAVVVAHGFGAEPADLAPIVASLLARGLSVLVPDASALPSFDREGGPPSPPTQGLGVAVDWAAAQTRASVGIVGHSMGGSAAVGVAVTRPRVTGVVTMGAVADPTTTRMSAIPAWLSRRALVVVRERIDGPDLAEQIGSRALARRPDLPLLIVHSRDDRTIPAVNARRLAAAGTSTQLRFVDDCRHDAVRLFQAAESEIGGFLDRALTTGPGSRKSGAAPS